jgi:hypothetical protein
MHIEMAYPIVSGIRLWNSQTYLDIGFGQYQGPHKFVVQWSQKYKDEILALGALECAKRISVEGQLIEYKKSGNKKKKCEGIWNKRRYASIINARLWCCQMIEHNKGEEKRSKSIQVWQTMSTCVQRRRTQQPYKCANMYNARKMTCMSSNYKQNSVLS